MGQWADLTSRWQLAIRKRLFGFSVPDSPSMDPEGGRIFEESLNNATCYLEFGAGGSTAMAARLGKSGVSIEGDRYFCRGVRRKIKGARHGMKLFYVNVGRTREWGYPIDQRPTPSNLAAWRRYVTRPFEDLAGSFYDLVLVDGRFRVACALHTISEAKRHNARVRLLVDDYQDPEDPRPHYKVIENYAPLTRIVGRMAVFDISPDSLLKMPDEAMLRASILDSR